MDQRYSCTSNTVKLLKHLDALQGISDGRVVPIMVHMMPTHRCQLNCAYCCFKNRADKSLDMPFDIAKSGISQFRGLGTKAIELTGGGDPTLYPEINELLIFLSNLGFHIGVNTNAVDSQLVRHWDLCDWIRVSMNTFDSRENLNLKPIRDSGATMSACYIWNEASNMNTLEKVASFCKDEKIICRIAPDCIRPLSEIDASVNFLREAIRELPNNEFLFLSDFNIDTIRHNENCFIHMIKPCFYTDGYVYPCPSSELAQENGSKMQRKFMVCRWDNIRDFYMSTDANKNVQRSCSYCKYEKQNVLLEDLLTETTFNEFA